MEDMLPQICNCCPRSERFVCSSIPLANAVFLPIVVFLSLSSHPLFLSLPLSLFGSLCSLAVSFSRSPSRLQSLSQSLSLSVSVLSQSLSLAVSLVCSPSLNLSLSLSLAVSFSLSIPLSLPRSLPHSLTSSPTPSIYICVSGLKCIVSSCGKNWTSACEQAMLKKKNLFFPFSLYLQ